MKLTMYRGDSAVFNLACKQVDGSPLDISTGNLYFTAKSGKAQSDTNAVFQKTIGNGITVVSGIGGTATVILLPSDTEDIYAPSVLTWDLQYISTGNLVFTLASGDLLVKRDVTYSSSYAP